MVKHMSIRVVVFYLLTQIQFINLDTNQCCSVVLIPNHLILI